MEQISGGKDISTWGWQLRNIWIDSSRVTTGPTFLAISLMICMGVFLTAIFVETWQGTSKTATVITFAIFQTYLAIAAFDRYGFLIS